MAFCTKCGTQIEADEKFCPNCGAPAEAQEKKQDVAEIARDILNTEDTTDQYAPEDINKNKGMSVLSYLGLLFLIPMFAAKESKYAQFHVRQGATLCFFDICYTIISVLLGLIKVRKVGYLLGLPYEYYGTPWYVSLLTGLLAIPLIALTIIGIVNAATGKAKKLPVIGNIDVLGWFGIK